MHNINLIFTIHIENGNCNSAILHKVIEELNPEIIFKELSHITFDEVYSKKCLTSLESNVIKKYLQNHNIEHIPVDTYNLPKHYYKNVDYMLDRIIKSVLIESRDLRNLIDYQSSLTNKNGFNFLNSDQNDELIEKINTLREKILNIKNDESLFKIARLEKEVINNREDEIIDNIYNFSKKNSYNQAILFIRSGHRKSMINKIEKRKSQEKVKINWTLH